MPTRTAASKAPRHRVDHGTICGRSCANSGHYKPLCTCVDRTFVKSVALACREFFLQRFSQSIVAATVDLEQGQIADGITAHDFRGVGLLVVGLDLRRFA